MTLSLLRPGLLTSALLPLLALLIAVQTASAAIYKQTDKDGKVTYTDNPGDKQTEKVDLPQLNTQPATPITPRTRKPSTDNIAINYQLGIDSPASGSHIPPGQRQLQVQVQLQPPLQPGHKLQAYLNDIPKGDPQEESLIVLQQLYRGEYQLNVSVLNANGDIIVTSAPIVIYVHRPSVAN